MAISILSLIVIAAAQNDSVLNSASASAVENNGVSHEDHENALVSGTSVAPPGNHTTTDLVDTSSTSTESPATSTLRGRTQSGEDAKGTESESGEDAKDTESGGVSGIMTNLTKTAKDMGGHIKGFWDKHFSSHFNVGDKKEPEADTDSVPEIKE